MSRRNRASEQRRRAGAVPGVRAVVVPGPKTRLKPIFEVFSEVNVAAHQAAAKSAGTTSSEGKLERAFFERAINAMKVTSVLLGNAHWEFATPIGRQLFEMCLNFEWLQRQDDRDAAIQRYVKFGLLQRMLSIQSQNAYDRSTGRPVDEIREVELGEMLTRFSEFRAKKDNPDGTARWVTSWCGKNTSELAKESAHGLRAAQYEQLFRGMWSEQTHSAPTVFLDHVFRTDGPTWIEQTVASDEVEITQSAGMATALFLDLWSMFSVIPQFDPSAAYRWMGVFRAARDRLAGTA